MRQTSIRRSSHHHHIASFRLLVLLFLVFLVLWVLIFEASDHCLQFVPLLLERLECLLLVFLHSTDGRFSCFFNLLQFHVSLLDVLVLALLKLVLLKLGIGWLTCGLGIGVRQGLLEL